MRKSIVWGPVLLVGSMVYWTLALGFGGLSLLRVTTDVIQDGDCAGGDKAGVSGEGDRGQDGFQSIVVNLGEGVDVGAQPAGAVTVDLVSDHDSARPDDNGVGGASDVPTVDRRGSGRRSQLDQGPGETAF